MDQKYNLSMIPGGVPVRIPVHQYDAGVRILKFNLKAGAEAYSVPNGSTVTIDGTKADGKGFTYACTASGSLVSATVTQQMTACPGEATCQLSISKGGTVLGSANFILAVEESALPDGSDLSETEISALETLKNQAVAAAENAARYADQTAGLISQVPRFVVGGSQPTGPAMWYEVLDSTQLLELSADTEGHEVLAEVEGVSYGVENADVTASPEAGRYGLDIL